jgi:hypothetical protein
MKQVEVFWHDIFELSASDWYSFDEIDIKIPLDKKGELCQTTSQLLRENDNHVVLVQTSQPDSKDKSDSSLSGVIVIPKLVIVKMRELE